MRRFCVVLFALLPIHAAVAQVTPAGGTQAQRASVQRDRDLERRALARQSEIAEWLRPEIRRRLDNSALGIVERMKSGHTDQDFSLLARRELPQKVGTTLKPAQADLLTFYILAETTRLLVAEVDKGRDTTTAVADARSLQLQAMMDREARFLSTLSNTLKKIADTQSSILQNIK